MAKRTLARIQRRFRRVLLRARIQHKTFDQGQRSVSPPIFVVGVQRSGTSLLRRILNSHPNIACPPESKFILPLEELFKHPQALQGLDSMGFSRDKVMGRLGTFVADFFREYAAAQGKSRWADKTPNYVDCLPFLDELFASTAQYIVIVRHPFDTCLSFEHAAQKSGQPMQAIRPYVAQAQDLRVGACQFWNEQNLKIAAFMPQVTGRVVAVSYELLTMQPEPVLRKIFGFLGEPWDPIVLDFNRARHDYGFEDRKIQNMPRIVENSAKFLAWPDTERLRLAAVAREAMETFGYDPHRATPGRAIEKLVKVIVSVDL